jgi:hypothetical protein
LDGAPYSLGDSAVAIWLINSLTQVRHCVAIIRKRYACKCGCRKWCTFWPIMFWIHYCFACLGEGIMPSPRRDHQPWTEQDKSRASKAGRAFARKGILLRFKGDWPELTERIGLPNWNSSLRPCFCCSCPHRSLYNVRGVNLLSLPWRVNCFSDYDAACKACEVWIPVDRATVQRLKTFLRFDKRKDGSLGRSLTKSFPDLGLREHDRLEPSASLPDIAGFERLCEDAPNRCERICFWRRNCESICLHRSPLWGEKLGITPERVLCLDLMHTLYLGVILGFVRMVIWKLLLSGR